MLVSVTAIFILSILFSLNRLLPTDMRNWHRGTWPLFFIGAFQKYMYVNDTHREKLCFTHFSTRIYWNRSLAASDLFHMFTQPIKFYIFHCHILKSADISTKWFIKCMENGRLLPSATFTAKFELFFVLKQDNDLL